MAGPSAAEPLDEQSPPALALEGPVNPVSVQPDRARRAPMPAVLVWLVAVLGGVAALAAAIVPVGPSWLGEVGAVVVATAFAAGLAERIGGRVPVWGGLALAVGAVVLLSDLAWDDPVMLRNGAAVMTAAVAAVLAVMATVPAPSFRHAVRECLIATVIAGIGAMAVLGLRPDVRLVSFEYAVLVVAGVGAFLVVYRLGAGLHGLGRRGIVIVLLGGALLAVSLLYAETLRRYGTPGLVDSLLDTVRWSRDQLGAFPRPIETILGIPALAWGTHMRARRRQGWWVCMFGVAATATTATALVNPDVTVVECALSVAYSLVLGLIIGWIVIRVDISLTGGQEPGGRSAGRRAATVGDASPAVRPEPARTAALL